MNGVLSSSSVLIKLCKIKNFELRLVVCDAKMHKVSVMNSSLATSKDRFSLHVMQHPENRTTSVDVVFSDWVMFYMNIPCFSIKALSGGSSSLWLGGGGGSIHTCSD